VYGAANPYTSEVRVRTNIEIDDKLMRAVLKETGLPTKKAAVEEALRLLLQNHRQRAIRDLVGKIEWEGDLDAWRERDREP